MTESDYKQCLAYARTSCKNECRGDAADVVSEAFIKMREKRLPYSFENIKPFIGNVLLRLRQEPKFVGLTESKLKISDPIFNIPPNKESESKQCKICKKVLSYREFYVNWNHYRWTWASYCKTCHNKKYNSNRTLKISRRYVIRLLKKKHTRAYLMAQSWVVDIKQDQLIRKHKMAV